MGDCLGERGAVELAQTQSRRLPWTMSRAFKVIRAEAVGSAAVWSRALRNSASNSSLSCGRCRSGHREQIPGLGLRLAFRSRSGRPGYRAGMATYCFQAVFQAAFSCNPSSSAPGFLRHGRGRPRSRKAATAQGLPAARLPAGAGALGVGEPGQEIVDGSSLISESKKLC